MQSPENLGIEHLQPLRRSLINLLSAPISEFTYAQIIDGQPTSDVYAADHFLTDGLTVSDHEEMDDGVHKRREHEEWLSEKLACFPEKSLDRKILPPPTLFWDGLYAESSRYPNGLADVVGYWAETQIFGGVVLFDRGESEEECNGIYLHNGRGGCTGITIAPPTREQFEGLVQYLLSSTPDHCHCPFPINITPDNRWRWHPYDARAKYHIFRNRHEIPEGPRPRGNHVVNAYDWPERIEEVSIRRELAKKEAGETFDEVFLTAAIETNRQITPTSRLWEYHKREIMELEPDRKKQGRPPYFFDP